MPSADGQDADGQDADGQDADGQDADGQDADSFRSFRPLRFGWPKRPKAIDLAAASWRQTAPAA